MADLGITAATDLSPLDSLERLERVRLSGFDARTHEPARSRLEARNVIVDERAGATRAPAHPFGDPNLKLAVIDHLVDSAQLTLPPLVAIDEYELDAENLDRLLAVPLSSEQLASIVELSWSGAGTGHVAHLLWPQFDGEDDTFAIRSLRGIEHLPNLERLVLEYAVAEGGLDATELARLRARGVVVELIA